MMCTNVSMWGPVYWTAENVTRCTCEIETIEEEKMEMVCTYHIVASTSPILLEAHTGFFKLSIKGKLDVVFFKIFSYWFK